MYVAGKHINNDHAHDDEAHANIGRCIKALFEKEQSYQCDKDYT